MAILGTIFFAALAMPSLRADRQMVLPLRVLQPGAHRDLAVADCLLFAAAALMLLLPSRAASATPSSAPVLDEGK